MASVIGIDLGTTNSVVAFLDGDRPEVIPNAEGQKLTPSVVLYDEEEGVLVGELARRQQINKPGQAVCSVKRFMGRRYSEAGDCLLGLNYQVEADEEDRVVIAIDDRRLRPEEVSAEILKNIKRTAETFLGEKVTQAVVTVPAHFNDSQRQATKEAGELAGLDVLRIVNEPTAAALAYGINKGKSETVAVFDFGGGTFDVTILEVSEDLFEVLSTNGDTALGGDDVDQVLYEYLCTQIQEQTGLDPTEDPSARQRIREAAQQAKCELSTMQKASIHLPFIVADGQEPKHYSGELEREQFEKMIVPLLERLIPPCKQALADASLEPEQIDTVLLVGGSTRIPAVQLVVQELFRQEPCKGVNPDETVAMGAAVQAGVITGSLQEVLLLDVTPLTLGIELAGGLFSTLIPRNSNVPISLEKTFTTVVDNQKAVQVHVLQGERKMAGENRTLAHFRLVGITAAPREVPEIAVKFHIDANGILDVTATDITSGSSKEVSVVSSLTAASPEDIERVIKESQEKAEEDREFLKTQRRIMQAERNSQMMETFIEKHFDDLGEDTVKMVRERMLRLDIAIQQRDLDAIANAEAELLAIGERHSDIYYAHKSSFET